MFLLGFLFIAGFATFTGVQFLAKEKLNIDLNGDGIADLNIDLDDDGLCDINCDTMMMENQIKILIIVVIENQHLMF